MAPKKLTEADKKSILELYREPQETTSTLADRYGVSNSTISRLLKASLPAKDYSRLIQQKRSSVDKPAAPAEPPQATGSKSKPDRTPDEPTEAAAPQEPPDGKPSPAAEKPAPILKKRDQVEEATPAAEKSTPSVANPRARRRRSSPGDQTAETAAASEEAAQLSLPTAEEISETQTAAISEETSETQTAPKKGFPKLRSERKAEPEKDLEEETVPSDWDAVSSTLDEDYDEDDEDDEDDDEDFEDEGENWDDEDVDPAPHVEKVEISPLTESSLPQLCYVVVERSSSELVALPLRSFAHLGEIPDAEVESRTLPVFDNHRVARRFSRRNQRVVKLPDGGLLQTTSPYLMAKGITRLLIDGQVFALEDYEDDYEDDEGDADG